MQLTDQSVKVLYEEERTEKMVMSMVNATVSHEIRNPINAIHCQTIVIKMLVDRLDDLMELLAKPDFCPIRFKERLTRMRRKIGGALLINISSEKLITFLVEDFLDLAQVRSGKFRRVDKNFRVCEPIEEVVGILSFKASHKNIDIKCTYDGLGPETRIRIDERRIMQVLLNLLSNAVKFTPTDGVIEIAVKLI